MSVLKGVGHLALWAAHRISDVYYHRGVTLLEVSHSHWIRLLIGESLVGTSCCSCLSLCQDEEEGIGEEEEGEGGIRRISAGRYQPHDIANHAIL